MQQNINCDPVLLRNYISTNKPSVLPIHLLHLRQHILHHIVP